MQDITHLEMQAKKLGIEAIKLNAKYKEFYDSLTRDQKDLYDAYLNQKTVYKGHVSVVNVIHDI